MIFTHGEIPGLVIIEPRIFGDERGHFFETFRQDKFEAFIGEEIKFVQDNQSQSDAGVLRGLHFQAPPFEQGKLVRVLKGSVLDIAADIRTKSPFYGKHQAIKLDAKNKTMFYIPPGFAHGFLALEDQTIFQYKCTNYYHPESEGALLWSCPETNISWGFDTVIVSEKDKIAPNIHSFKSPF